LHFRIGRLRPVAKAKKPAPASGFDDFFRWLPWISFHYRRSELRPLPGVDGKVNVDLL